MKDGLISRMIAAVILSLVGAWAITGDYGTRLAWLNSTSPDEVVARYRSLYSHPPGYVLRAVGFLVFFILFMLCVEIVAALVRRYWIDQ